MSDRGLTHEPRPRRRLFRRKPERGLTYSATARCKCGAGLAYRQGDDAWDCSDILLGIAIPSGQPGSEQHTAHLPRASSVSDDRATKPSTHGGGG